MPLGDIEKKLVAIAIIAVLAIINVRGTRESTRVLGLATLLKVVALVVLQAASVNPFAFGIVLLSIKAITSLAVRGN